MNTVINPSIADVNANEINTKANTNIKSTEQVTVQDVKKPEPEPESKPVANVSVKQLEMVAQQLQEFVGGMNKSLEFLVDKDSGRDVIKIIDKTNGNLIKQYPSEEVLDLVSKLSQATGAFVNEKI